MFASRLSSFFLVVAFGLAALGAFSATPGNESDVRRFVNDFALSLSDPTTPDAVVAFYARDASHIGSDGKRVTGEAALARYFGSRDRREVRADIDHVSFISEQVVLVDGTFRIASELERFALVARESSEGWKIVASRMATSPPVAE